MCGDRDETFTLPVIMELYQSLPNAELWIAPGSGHPLYWTEWGGSRQNLVFLARYDVEEADTQ